MQIRWLTAYLDFAAAQFGTEVTYWRAITGSTVSPPRGPHREFATLEPFTGDSHLRVQRIEEGPGGVHLDIHLDDPRRAAVEVTELGGSLVADHPTHLVYESPAGMRFCLVPVHGTPRRSGPIRWPEDTISIIDQICIDVPPTMFDREVTFWSLLTGRPTRPGSRPELIGLRRDRALGLGILLQRLDSGTGDDGFPVRASAHLDLATTSVVDEVGRHEGWGATVVTRFAHWTVMADPVGRRYCITDRNPRTGQ
ncbi:VOC family protein [Gordonia sp. DT30]|uniref:VOC family protein n=1 Tax=Gordonia sp. DT30 TaxID=3416546 RepID=UPI003CF1224B